MLTPAKIKNHHFDASGRNAYRADSVDSFFEEVADSYEQVFRENGEMYKKINLLAERLEEYRKDEDNIRNALLTAQRMAEKITREAKESADAALNEALERAASENEKTTAAVNELISGARYQAQAIIDDANRQAAKIIDDATHESKAAAVSARDSMIKEEALLEMMKLEVTKFKNQILEKYNEQLALVEQLPEVVYAKFEAEEPAEEPVEEITEEAAAEAAEEPASEVVEEPAEEPAIDTRTAEDMDVEQLQQMIEETEDTDADEDPYVEEPQPEAQAEEADEQEEPKQEGFVLPEIDDEPSNEDLTKIVDNFSTETAESGDVFFSKPVTNDENENGFKVNFENINSFESAEEIFEDDDDEYDDDDGGESLASKFKGFFKK